MKYKYTAVILILPMIFFLLYSYCFHDHFPTQKDSMIVLHSTTSVFEDHYIQNLTIVLNQRDITDYESCAHEIIQHCMDNDFPETVFSYDTLWYPAGIRASVYEISSDVSNHNPLFQFFYTQDTIHLPEYNICDHPEMFQLTIY